MALLPRMKKAGMGTFCSVQVQGGHRRRCQVPDKDGVEQFDLADLVLIAAAAGPTTMR